MSSAESAVHLEEVETAEEFLDKLSPRGPIFRESLGRSRWIFRGQYVDEPLVPTALRDGAFLYGLHTGRWEHVDASRWRNRTNVAQAFIELGPTGDHVGTGRGGASVIPPQQR